MGVLLLSGFAIASIAVLALAVFGPQVPGPNVTELFTEAEEEPPPKPCDPRKGRVREPRQAVAAPGRWRSEPRIPGAYDEVRGAALDGRVFVLNGQAGGRSVARVQTYDPRTGGYADAPSTPVAVDHTAVVTYDGDLYLVGGDSDGRPTDGLWRYSPETRTWTELTPMEIPRAGHAAAVIGDRLYVVGGTSDSEFSGADNAPLEVLEIYDFEADAWTQGPDMPTGRHHFDAAAVDGRLYAIGGRRPGEFALDTVERFDPESGKWEQLPPLPLGTGGASVVEVADNVVVVGGGDDLEGWVTPASWALDPDRGRWRRLPDLRTPRHGQAAAVLDGRIYVFAGAPCALYGRTHKVESLSVGSVESG